MELLKQIMNRVRSGEMTFKPESSSENDVEYFQRVANRLDEAKQQQLIHDVKFVKNSERGNIYFTAAFVLGGLTYKGEKFIEMETISENTTPLDIFISHSTEDSEVAERFITLLRAAIQIDPARIRCSSVDGHRLPAGSNINEQLKLEVFEATVFVVLLSQATLTSIYTLFELGARWGTGKYLAPILVRGTIFEALKQPLSSLNAIESSSQTSVAQFLLEISALLEIKMFDPHSYSRQLQAFCEF